MLLSIYTYIFLGGHIYFQLGMECWLVRQPYVTFFKEQWLSCKVTTSFYVPISSVWGHQLLHILSNTCYCPFFDYRHLSRYDVVYLTMVRFAFLWWLMMLSTFCVLFGSLCISPASLQASADTQCDALESQDFLVDPCVPLWELLSTAPAFPPAGKTQPLAPSQMTLELTEVTMTQLNRQGLCSQISSRNC